MASFIQDPPDAGLIFYDICSKAKMKFKIGDSVRVTKERCPQLPHRRSGVVIGISANAFRGDYMHYIDYGTVDKASWYGSSLELNDHVQPCACFDCS